MAAEYQLYLKDEIIKVEIKDIFSTLNWQYTEEKIEDKGFLFSFMSIVGFLLYVINISSTIEIGLQKVMFNNIMTFRFINQIHFLISKKNMLRYIVELIKYYDGDFILLFNGEIVIMLKNKEDGLVLSNTDFWTQELLKELNDLTYCRKDFEVL